MLALLLLLPMLGSCSKDEPSQWDGLEKCEINGIYSGVVDKIDSDLGEVYIKISNLPETQDEAWLAGRPNLNDILIIRYDDYDKSRLTQDANLQFKIVSYRKKKYLIDFFTFYEFYSIIKIY